MNNSITFTKKNHLCTGCGICEDICPTHSIEITRINGEHRPVLNKATCLSPKCGKCLKVCPGIGVNLVQMAQAFYTEDGTKENKYIGRFKETYTGYSLDEDVRYHSASGGLVSQFLIYLLEKKIIDGAVVTGFSKQDHITPVSYIARTKEEVIKARSSKYCPVALNKVGNEVTQSEGKYVIIGLPCHIQGFRKRAAIDKRFREKVIGYFSIYCSSNRSFYAQDYLLQKYSVDRRSISYFAYRDNGCLGNMVVQQGREFPSQTTKKSSVCKESKSMISIPFTHYYGALRSFFKPRRCLTCVDHYGELADICFGDIHIKPYSDDMVGTSSCIVRNDYWNIQMYKAVKDGYITLVPIDAHTLNESQKEMLYPKMRKARALMNLDKTILRRQVVVYDKELDKPSVKDYVSVIVTNAQRFIGRHRSLWFLIKWLNKNR